MKISVIRDDKLVIIDGTGYAPISMDGLKPTIRAIQWNGVTGHEEFDGGENLVIDSFDKYNFLVDRWELAREQVTTMLLFDEDLRSSKCATIDQKTRKTIEQQFIYRGQRVRLTREDQHNYMMINEFSGAFDWPLTIKVWSETPWEPEFLTFEDKDDYASFCFQWSQHIYRAIMEGVKSKKETAKMTRDQLEGKK
jgi:hypothetical protein